MVVLPNGLDLLRLGHLVLPQLCICTAHFRSRESVRVEEGQVIPPSYTADRGGMKP